MPYGGYGGGGVGYAIDRVFAIGLLHHARRRAYKHLLRKKRRHQRKLAKAREKRLGIRRGRILPLKLKPTRQARQERAARSSEIVIETPVVVPIMAPAPPPAPRRPAPPQRVYQYTPAPPRDLHAGYHAARGGPPAPVSPARATLRILHMQPGGSIEECYTPPGDRRRPPSSAPYVPQPASPVSPAPAPRVPSPAAPAAPAPAPAPVPTAAPVKPTGYQGDHEELVKALRSNFPGMSRADAVAMVKSAGLTADDDEASALVKVFRARK